MPVNREPNTQKNYTIWGGGFLGGLFDSIDGALIPDNALHAISNLHIDHYGVLHTVTKPVENEECYTDNPATGAIRAIMGSWCNLWINKAGTLYNEGPQVNRYAVDQNTAQMADSPANTGFPYYVVYTSGLWSTAGAGTTGTNLRFADQGIIGNGTLGDGTPMSSTICEQEGRIWFNLAHILRGSDVTDPDLEETWRGPLDPVDETTMTLANTLFFAKMQQQIRYLLKMNGSLYIFCDDGIYAQNTFIDGTQRPVYLGAAMPRFGSGAPFRIYTDGQMAYWVGNNKFYAFSGSRPQVISDKLNLPAIVCWFTGEYDNRLWFLTSTAALPTGSQVNYIYAIDRDSGAWEKYDIQMTSAASPNIDTPTAMGSNRLIQDGARVALSPDDVLSQIKEGYVPLPGDDSLPRLLLNDQQQQVYPHITFEPVHLDELARLSGLGISSLMGITLSLELKHAIRQLPGQYYVRNEHA